MKVLHVIPAVAPRYGGPSQAVVGTGRALAQQGVDVLIATTDADGDGRLPVALGVTRDYEGVRTVFFRRQWSESLKYSRPMALWLNAHVAEFRVVHIHAVFSHACLAAARACQWRRVPYVVRPLGSLDPWSLRQKPLRKGLLWHLGARQMLTRAAAVHYTTRAEQRLAEAPLGLRRGVVIPVGIDLEPYQAPADVARFRFRHPSLGEHPYVLVLGRLHPKKGLELLLEAFFTATADPRLRDWRLLVAGDGDPAYVAQVRRGIRDRAWDDRVVFSGWLAGAEKLAALQGAALLALPSHQENFGQVVVEALACGVPVLLSQHVNLAEDVQSAGAGWVVRLEPSAIVAGLCDALSQPQERQRRGAAGRQLASHFDWARVASQLTSLYGALAAS